MRQRWAAALVAAAACAAALVPAAAGATGAVGAAGAAGADAAVEKPEACQLLKRKEIRSAFGDAVARARAGAAPEICDWPLRSPSKEVVGTVHAQVIRKDSVKKDYARLRRFEVDDGEAVDDVGRKALYKPSLGAVYVLVDGSTMFYVQALYQTESAATDEDLRDGLVELAGRAMRRI